MKKIIAFLLILPFIALAQVDDYNKFSLEIDGGLLKPYKTFTYNYGIDNPTPFLVNLGARYMFNTKIGLKIDGGFHRFKNNDNSLEFTTEYYRGSLQGVINIANIADLKSTFLKNFGLLLHTGAGVSNINFKTPIDGNDWTIHGIIGLTPQVKLSERISLQADLSIITNLSQDKNFDGVGDVEDNFFDGNILTTTIGLAFNLGKADSHADWADANPWKKEIEELNKKIAKIETDMIDTDQDGVPDYLDREPNTASGASVNTKGITVDLNNNGIPDEYETSLDRKYLTEPTTPEGTLSYDDTIKKLVNDGYINVYFDTNSATPASHSINSINYLIRYMTSNTSANAEIIGYADQRGSEAYNTQLSERRAKKIMNILKEAGINESRLTNLGKGETPSANTKSALQLNRKVTFILK